MMGITVFDAQITALLEYSGIQWSGGQIGETARLAYDEYHWMSLGELKQFFIRVKKGVYNSHKNMIPPVFMEFLTEYGEEMKAARYEYYSQEAQKTKWTPPENPVSDDVFNEKMAEIMAVLKTPEEQTIAEKFGSADAFEKHRQEMIKKLSDQQSPSHE